MKQIKRWNLFKFSEAWRSNMMLDKASERWWTDEGALFLQSLNYLLIWSRQDIFVLLLNINSNININVYRIGRKLATRSLLSEHCQLVSWKPCIIRGDQVDNRRSEMFSIVEENAYETNDLISKQRKWFQCSRGKKNLFQMKTELYSAKVQDIC